MNRIEKYLASRSERERRVLLLGLGLGLPLLLYMALWQPLLDSRDQAREKLEQKQQAYIWMQEAASQLRAAGTATQAAVVSGSPQQQITAAAAAQGLVISRIEPQSGDQYSVWLASADYDRAVRLVDALSKGGLVLHSINISALDQPARVSMRILAASGL